MSKFRAVLIMVVASITGGSFIEAAAEKSVFTPGEIILKDRELASEAERHKDELDKKGFSFIWTVNVPAAGGSPVQVKLPVVRQPDANGVISLWFESTYGEVAMELHDPTGRVVVSWGGKPGEQSLELTPGRYVVVVQAINGAHVHGVIGLKGPIGRCAIKGIRLTEHAADPAHGYWSPYLLVTPSPRAPGAPRRLGAGTLLVTPNSIGGNMSEDIEFMTAWATCGLTTDINALNLAEKLGTPVLVPLFPRPILPAKSSGSEWSDLYLPGLTRASLKEKSESFNRVDLQLIAMIKSARKELVAKGRPVQTRVLMAGFSAAGMFTNRFTVLHPEQVLAAAVGSPGGWPIAPVSADQGETLRYPVGIADAKELTGHEVDLKALRRVRFLFFLGDADTNDSVPCPDSYSEADAKLINRRFGEAGVICGKPGGTLASRWCQAERLYRTAGVHANFRTYADDRGVSHWVTPKMQRDILETFQAALGARSLAKISWIGQRACRHVFVR